MSQIMKSFLGVFLILFMTVSSVGILSGFLSVIAAQNEHAQIIDELEDSDFCPEVKRDCFRNVSANNQSLVLTLYLSDNTVQTVSNDSEVPYDTQVNRAFVELKFNYSVDFFGICEEHVLSGYAM